MHTKYFCILLVSVIIFGNVSLAQKVVKKVPPPKSTYKEFKSKFSMVDDPKPVKYLKSLFDTVKYIPQHFYIAAINDSTYSNDSIGFTLQPTSGKKQKLMFENGFKNAFNIFFDKKIKKDSNLYPVIINIRQFSITEKRQKPYDVGTFSYKYEFLYPGKNKMEKIGSPSGYGDYYSTIGLKKNYDSLIGQSFDKNFLQLDNIMGEMIEKSPALCKGVKIAITSINDRVNANDTIYYSPDLELRREDFMGESKGAENTFGAYLDLICEPGEVQYANTYYTIPITIGAGFVKSGSWLGSVVKDPWVLYHMNYRLKLTQVYALRLKKRIEQKQFTCENFNAELRNLHSGIFKEMNVEMDNYDTETHYGQNKKAELRWQSQITDELLEENK